MRGVLLGFTRDAPARSGLRVELPGGEVSERTLEVAGRNYRIQRILNGEPRRPHYGVDIAVPTGTPVTAPAPGIVTLAVPDMFFSRGTMIIDHGHRLSSSFLHLSKLHAKEGDRVETGDRIAEAGATGRVTGPHLDWRMNLRDRRIDPQLLVPPMPEEAPEPR